MEINYWTVDLSKLQMGWQVNAATKLRMCVDPFLGVVNASPGGSHCDSWCQAAVDAVTDKLQICRQHHIGLITVEIRILT